LESSVFSKRGLFVFKGEVIFKLLNGTQERQRENSPAKVSPAKRKTMGFLGGGFLKKGPRENHYTGGQGKPKPQGIETPNAEAKGQAQKNGDGEKPSAHEFSVHRLGRRCFSGIEGGQSEGLRKERRPRAEARDGCSSHRAITSKKKHSKPLGPGESLEGSKRGGRRVGGTKTLEDRGSQAFRKSGLLRLTNQEPQG